MKIQRETLLSPPRRGTQSRERVFELRLEGCH